MAASGQELARHRSHLGRVSIEVGDVWGSSQAQSGSQERA